MGRERLPRRLLVTLGSLGALVAGCAAAGDHSNALAEGWMLQSPDGSARFCTTLGSDDPPPCTGLLLLVDADTMGAVAGLPPVDGTSYRWSATPVRLIAVDRGDEGVGLEVRTAP